MQTKYDFSVGQIVENKVKVSNEIGEVFLPGTKLRIVAITPKVRETPKIWIQDEPTRFDSKEYFLNLVLASQENDWSNRIRENFVTVKKIKD